MNNQRIFFPDKVSPRVSRNLLMRPNITNTPPTIAHKLTKNLGRSL